MAVKKTDPTKEFADRTLPFRKPKGKLKAYHIRMYDTDWSLLKEYFEDQGLTISAGLRQITRTYMKENGLR